MRLLSEQETWKRLPAVETGGGQPLPSWALALADALPYTTAAMLELDRTFRTSDSLDLKLAAAIRLVVAQVLRCYYGQAYAEADLNRQAVDQATIDQIAGDRARLPAAERAPLAFAEKLTQAGYTVTDEEVAFLVEQFGEDRVVAIVLHVAFANFFDRLVLALGLPLEAGGPLAPSEIRFAQGTVGGSNVPPAPRPARSKPSSAVKSIVRDSDPDWSTFGFEQLQARLEAQRERTPRITIPTWDEVRQVLPAGLYNPDKPLEIRWSRLVSGRQPRLGPAWVKCTRTFENESKQDRAFEESLFWVVTRTLRCFYCMGHCEMLLEVAGLSREDVATRTRQLAGDDWSDFEPAEQVAFSFARKLTTTPWAIDADDIHRLENEFGSERALDVVWWSSRCQFMTKVSDAFQLPLERENVFHGFQAPKEEPDSGPAPARARR
jgi:alkylhydroperoxidase family enzyme